MQKTLIFGCGALGSKMALHLARSGYVNLTLVDSGNLSPHNLVRHALTGERVGASKAEGLRDAIVELYPIVEKVPVAGHKDYVHNFLVGDKRHELHTHTHLLDATATQVVFNALCLADIPDTLRVYRTEIADEGRIGLSSIEGHKCNPRLDDFEVLLFDAAIEDTWVSSWVTRIQAKRDDEVGSGLEEIQVGLSCSSATMRLADEVVSLHAAAATRRLRGMLESGEKHPAGGLFRTGITT